jgi:hypothetical protein
MMGHRFIHRGKFVAQVELKRLKRLHPLDVHRVEHDEAQRAAAVSATCRRKR